MDTPVALDEPKSERFRALVRHASAHAPYYSKVVRERGIDLETCVPSDFPVLTKSILMSNFDEIVTDRRVSKTIVADFLTRSSNPQDRLFNELTVMHTSGTSGEVGYFLYAPADYKRMNQHPRRNGRAFRGLLKGRKKPFSRIRVAFYGATGGHYAGVTSIASMQRGLRRLLVRAAAFEVNTPLPDIVDALNEFQPDFLIGYTTALRMLATEQCAGRLKVSPRAVVASGEVTTKSDLDTLSGAFEGARSISIYACTEHMMLGVSSPDGDSMLLTDDNLVFEFYEDHSIITNLFNFTVPMIRYRMSDILQPITAPGVHPIMIRNLVGRAEQMPIFQNSAGGTDFLSPHTINEIFVKGVSRFQMQITGPTSFRFPFCVDAGMDDRARRAAADAVAARLKEILLQKGLGNVTFEAPIVDAIAVNPRTRKFQLITDERKSAEGVSSAATLNP
jgi:phenylacetate-CoA ligase